MRKTIKALARALHLSEDAEFLNVVLEWAGLRPKDFMMAAIAGLVTTVARAFYDTNPLDLILYGVAALAIILGLIAVIRLLLGPAGKTSAPILNGAATAETRADTPHLQSKTISLSNVCCYLAYHSKWSDGQVTQSPAYSVKVSNEIRDVFGQGKLTATGRPFDAQSPRWLALKTIPEKLPSDWWKGKRIDAWRAMQGEESANIIFNDVNEQSGFHDITVRSADVEKIWPKR
jgi:hypothetical protein